MIKNIKTLLFLFVIIGLCSQTVYSKSFVKVINGQFILNETPYYFMGTNFWYGAILGSDTKDGNRARLIKELDFMKKLAFPI